MLIASGQMPIDRPLAPHQNARIINGDGFFDMNVGRCSAGSSSDVWIDPRCPSWRISVTESDLWLDGDPFADRVVSEIAARASSKPSPSWSWKRRSFPIRTSERDHNSTALRMTG